MRREDTFCMRCNKNLSKNNSGFTLLELIVTVVILALVTAPFLSSFVTASKTNLKAKRIEVGNEISQEIIERFKGSTLNYMVSQYGMSEILDGSGNPTGGYKATISGNTAKLKGYKGYKADIEIVPTAADVNGDKTPVLDLVSTDSTVLISNSVVKYDKSYATATKKVLDVTIEYNDGSSDPAAKGYHVKSGVTYYQGGVSYPGGVADVLVKETDSTGNKIVPSIYITYKALRSADEINITNTVPDTVLAGDLISIHLISQEGPVKIIPQNVKINDGSGSASLHDYNDNPSMYALNNISIYTNVLTSNGTAPNIYNVVRTENVDYIYNLTVKVKYGDKTISTVKATKNIVG